MLLNISTNRSENFLHATVVLRYNKDPVVTNNIWKHGRITVKCVETNPALTNRFWQSQRTIYPTIMIFFLSLTVGKNDMIQMVDKPNMTPIDQDSETLTFKATCV